jgi:hypothetical protein
MTAGNEAIGSLAEEAARLLGAAQQWAQRIVADAPISTGGADCQWCPMCQLIAALRGDRPELTAKAVDTVTTVVEALQAAFGGHEHAAPAPPTGVQRIDLSEHSAPNEREI